MKKLLTFLMIMLPCALFAQEQVYNFSFDTWSKTKGAWDLYPEHATAKHQV